MSERVNQGQERRYPPPPLSLAAPINKTTILANFTWLLSHRPTIKEIFHLKKTFFSVVGVYVYGLELFFVESFLIKKESQRACSNKSFIIT